MLSMVWVRHAPCCQPHLFLESDGCGEYHYIILAVVDVFHIAVWLLPEPVRMQFDPVHNVMSDSCTAQMSSLPSVTTD